MYINTFKYTPKDVSCQLCTEYVKKLGCTALRCPWLAERIEAGVVGYREAVLETFPHERRLFQRLNLLIKHYPGSLWSNEQHERRMQYQCAVQGYRRRRDTNAYYAAMYLLTSNDDIYRRTANCFCKDGIEFGYPGEEPFIDGRDWGTLCCLLNEDYHDLLNRNVQKPDSCAQLLFDRYDRAGQIVGIAPRLGKLPEEIRKKLAEKLEAEAAAMLKEKQDAYPDSFDGKTIIIECARGGPDGASMPLTGSDGYQYSLPMFCPEILENAAILYIWVTPEESRRKNADRADPNDPGSNLHHGVPLAVMLGEYGCDDMEYLVNTSEQKGTVTVKAHGNTYHVPIGIFDNRVDKTSFLRAEPSAWDAALVEDVTCAIRQATDTMWAGYRK